MENAIKALMICAIVLLVILIISLGMYIYNSSADSMHLSETMTEFEIIEKNHEYELYSGVRSGRDVKTLLRMASENNEELYLESSTIKYCVCIRSNVPEILKDFSTDAEMTRGLNGTREYGVRYPSNIKDIADQISDYNQYKIWFKYNDDGFIWEINIDEPK